MLKKFIPLLLTLSSASCMAAQLSALQPTMSITTANVPEHDSAMKKTLSAIVTESAPTTLDTQSIVVSDDSPKKIKRNRVKKAKNNVEATMPLMRFDITYHDDVNNLIDKLKEYVPSLHELAPLGKKEHISFNADLSNTNINEIATSLNYQTDGKVNLVYESVGNSIRLIFSSKITKSDFAADIITESKKIKENTKLKLVTGTDGVIKMPFGGPYPVICKPLKMCDIRLEQGELVRGWTLSDKENWILPGSASPQFLYSGPDGGTTPHVVLKPAEAGLDSNLIITTNKRTYNITLQSSKDNYVTTVAYYYPEEINQGLEDQHNELRQQVQNQGLIPLDGSASDATNNTNSANADSNQVMVPVGSLNFNYEVSGDDVDWKPVKVFDDGTHVWLKFSQARQEYPPLFEIDSAGASKALLIYQPMPGGYYRVDSLFKKAALIVGDGSDYEKKVIITKLALQKPWYKRIFGSSNES